MSKVGRTVRIAVDIMAGDYAPEQTIKGAVTATRKADVKIILAGPEDILEEEPDKCYSSHIPVEHVRADEFILSIGAEESKSRRWIQESYPLLQNSGLDFIANIEASSILSAQANVIVCDGIVGNVLIKFYESIGHYFAKSLTSRLDNLPLVGPVKTLLDQMLSFTRITSTESDGGGLLWGVNGVVHLLHGNSQAPQVAKTITRAKHAIETDLVRFLKSEPDMIQIKCKDYLSANLQPQQRTTPAVAAHYIYSQTK